MPANLFAGLPAGRLPDELTETILANSALRIERIVSTGQASPPGFWYDQEEGEWVAVLRGSARLRIEGESEARLLRAGDFIDLPPHTRHRVEWTDPKAPTVWLAVFYRVSAAPRLA
jgi:cupin 2 domain-containing protein